jgi:hypothetical protein
MAESIFFELIFFNSFSDYGPGLIKKNNPLSYLLVSKKKNILGISGSFFKKSKS